MEVVESICHQIGHAFNKTAYRPMNVVWMFILQVLSHDNDCVTAVTRLNSLRAEQGLSKLSSDSSAYCKARGRLPEELFGKLLRFSADRCGEVIDHTWRWCSREVYLVDGWTVTMSDTAENQREYPQMRSQRPGIGFPIARMVGVFSLASAAAVELAIGPYRGKSTGEPSLLRRILPNIPRGGVLLADRYYGSFWMLAQSERSGIDLVTRTHQLRRIDFRRGLKHGSLDQVVRYERPPKPRWMTAQEYATYPRSIFVRHLRYRVQRKGYRTKTVTIATTLLDAGQYTVEELSGLYGRRWEVELHIRSIKTHMQAEHLRCHRPSMIRKEIHTHLIAYNLIRLTIEASALAHQLRPTRLSFERSRGELCEYAGCVRTGGSNLAGRWKRMLSSIAEAIIGDRPGRQEPREVKRRPKNYKLMTKPRDPNRNRYAKAA